MILDEIVYGWIHFYEAKIFLIYTALLYKIFADQRHICDL